jgi:DNA-binding response OmpR family regulator
VTSNILLVEESPLERRLLAQVLESAGHRVTAIENATGTRGTQILSSVDLAIVSSLGESGVDLELIQWLRRQATAAKLPILTLFPDATVHARQVALSMGASDYVARPFSADFLMSRVQSLLNHRRNLASVAPQGFARRVLVVDDSPTYGYALLDELHKDGHDVAFAETGTDGLAFLNRHRVDLVVLDIFLPDINGVEVCRNIKTGRLTSTIPVLILTGREKSAVRADAAAAHADDFVLKSRDLDAIRVKVRRLLFRNATRILPADNPVTAAADLAPLSRQDSPSRNAVVEVNSNRMSAATDPNKSPESTDLFKKVVQETGLSELLACSAVENVCRRLDVDPHTLSTPDLPRVIAGLERTLALFLPPSEFKERQAALNALAR